VLVVAITFVVYAFTLQAVGFIVSTIAVLLAECVAWRNELEARRDHRRTRGGPFLSGISAAWSAAPAGISAFLKIATLAKWTVRQSLQPRHRSLHQALSTSLCATCPFEQVCPDKGIRLYASA